MVCKGEEQKHFSSLGTKPHFYVNSSRKNYIIVLTTNTPPTWPPCHVVASQKLLRFDDHGTNEMLGVVGSKV